MEAGIVGPERMACLEEREMKLSTTMMVLSSLSLPRTEWSSYGSDFRMQQKDGKYKNAIEVLSMPNITLNDIIRAVKDVGEKRNDLTLQVLSEKDSFLVIHRLLFFFILHLSSLLLLLLLFLSLLLLLKFVIPWGIPTQIGI